MRTIHLKNLDVEIPPKEQFFQWFAHMTYIFLGIYALSLYRVPAYYLICLAINGVAELAIGYYRSGGKKIRFPVTAFISAGTFYMFIESINPEVYVLGSMAAVASKYLIRFENRHVFNPGNVAVLFVVILLPRYAVSVPGQWGGDLWVVFVVAVLGAIVATLANRLWAALAYLVFFVIFSWVRAAIFHVSPWFLAGSVIGIPSMIFLFHMITDPATSPSKWKPQILYGGVIALLDVLLRYLEIIYAPIIALAIVTSLRPLVSVTLPYLPVLHPLWGRRTC